MNQSRYATIVRVGAVYDVIATLPFAIPFVAGWALQVFAGLDAWLGLGTPFARLDATSLFFINLGALAYVVWGIARWRQPTVSNGRLDAALRLAVIGLQLYALSQGATPILWGLAAVLLLLAVLQLRTPASVGQVDEGRALFTR
ncbi:hypothetical protein C4Q28_24190 [Pseudomonas sp. SWI6]|uniref:hypothetical protein n=1 Tax=Pseudomonas TaxID=286 RepID=UPI0003C09CCF|nr:MULTISPECIES: hypothetical protein [Pseudomonas]AGZ33369.1 hypothetical protein PVLB_02800 [Pseudomonas sp. VLB120]AVD85047.1 hypothetical protein C4Q28_24190 [Pseudomonas sp. SWI6]AVD87279.1 hypothetical protein C4Q26_09035 [Pseudomonas sp. SWI44]MBC3491291.1 hypothetical protein [Pseudomonas taiwanensis]MDT8926122.1 hypothetical protein [Pseudomonas taiwanensis]